jgi:hypothetical protein
MDNDLEGVCILGLGMRDWNIDGGENWLILQFVGLWKGWEKGLNIEYKKFDNFY